MWYILLLLAADDTVAVGQMVASVVGICINKTSSVTYFRELAFVTEDS